MDTYRNELVRQLVRDGLRKGTVGAVTKRGNKKLGERSSALDPKFTAANREGSGQEESSGVWLCWVNPNPHMTKRKDKRARLVICE